MVAEQEIGQLTAGMQVRVTHRPRHLAAVLHRMEGKVGMLGDVVADQGAGTTIVDALPAQSCHQFPGPLRGQGTQPRAQQGVLLAAEVVGGVATAAEQSDDDLRDIEMIHPDRQQPGVETTIVAAHVVVEEPEPQALLVTSDEEFGLPGGDECGVEKGQQVLACDLVCAQHRFSRGQGGCVRGRAV